MKKLVGLLRALLILLACFLVAIGLTFLLYPFWSWLERRFGIEAVGHSGPAEWCFLVVAGVMVLGVTGSWLRRRYRDKHSTH